MCYALDLTLTLSLSLIFLIFVGAYSTAIVYEISWSILFKEIFRFSSKQAFAWFLTPLVFAVDMPTIFCSSSSSI